MPLTTLCRGNQIVALVPTPTSLSISNPPSCSSANDFTKGSPSTVDESGDPALFTEGIAEICRRIRPARHERMKRDRKEQRLAGELIQQLVEAN